ncbi:hypothetical protein HYC85_002689 [Camellia sinensis]|uniref:Uncharacterized protein n=1 Tax=Camellia sinensis TaxID=4442 RepID=A0A7J7I906_CAMSI|nr:hypothetical protein HYC85_002689 [Camellia sinensis]
MGRAGIDRFIVAYRSRGMPASVRSTFIRGYLESAHLGSPALFSIAGSPRLEIYNIDFGWGRPRKVEVTSIDKSGAFSLADSRDGNGGLQIGIVLNKHEIEAFASLFASGLDTH